MADAAAEAGGAGYSPATPPVEGEDTGPKRIESLGLKAVRHELNGIVFEVEKRYKIRKAMSHGAYGFVCSAEDRKAREDSERNVAVKKTEGVFEHLTIAKRTLRELLILRHLQHENIVKVRNIFTPASRDRYEDIYVVSELMDTDLSTTLKLTQPLSEEHNQFFLYQILRGMKYVHSAHVIHRDLKPRNLLVNRNCDLKICDFGLARICFQDKSWVCPLTEYVCTRWYRAPEVLCSYTEYSTAIDIWSIGCILAEMLSLKALFPGKNTQETLDLIINVLGHPNDEELTKIPNEKCRRFIRSLPNKSERSLNAICAGYSPEARDFLDKTLTWDPEKRMSTEEAISHPMVEKLHCPEDEPTRAPLDTAEFEFERRKITLVALREEIFREMLRYHTDKFGEDCIKEQFSDVRKYQLLVPNESGFSSDDDSDDSKGAK